MPYIATIEILVNVETHSECADTIAKTMQNNMQAFNSQSCLLDWKWAEDIGRPTMEPCNPIPNNFKMDDPWPDLA